MLSLLKPVFIALLAMPAVARAQETPPGEEEAAPVPSDQIGVLGTLHVNGGDLDGVFGELLHVGGSLDPTQVEVTFDREAHTLTVTNHKAYPITFTLELSKANNVTTRPRQPVQTVLKPGRSLQISFRKRDPNTPRSYAYGWGWKMGSMKAKHRPRSPYQLPWPEDLTFKCMQGYDGEYSHRGEHALDIQMPVGTPILAARAGRVVGVIDGWGEGAPERDYDDKANSIQILHRDGTYATYVHLQAGEMRVSLGDSVRAGQVIGMSGNSGYSSEPHLHFAIKSPLDGWVTRTHAVRFQIDEEILMLRQGKWYPGPQPDTL